MTELLAPQQPLTLTLTTDTQTQQMKYHQMVDCYEELG